MNIKDQILELKIIEVIHSTFYGQNQKRPLKQMVAIKQIILGQINCLKQ